MGVKGHQILLVIEKTSKELEQLKAQSSKKIDVDNNGENSIYLGFYREIRSTGDWVKYFGGTDGVIDENYRLVRDIDFISDLCETTIPWRVVRNM